ncbi:hypothetical protein [Cellulomonas chengniuliangii]|uniref:DUF4166 domain-containing protein n=1 Tax=Cellulomonas chengniuliangii TaxID=2968084 RepID=A0ABY5L4B2_9CELL|nr:hypothetical protein [Cellulomonas chengniuliangii]MCC2308392.1 hypothetical protein [Cellulomonas chengniuliangii]UUI76770.1 hypothetical protein NP064_07825 [Cellulomonas chengniuliangii]
MSVLAFDGHIAALGAVSGVRLVVGRWLRSPFGRFADVMVSLADGRRLLLAPTDAVADLVATTYSFDEVHLAPVVVGADPRLRTWRVTAGPLEARFRIGGRTALGRVLHAVPGQVSGSRLFAGAVDPIARAVLPGVRTSGSAGHGRHEWYAASDQHAITDAQCSWGGRDLGGLADVHPPVAFGFGSAPRQPSVTRLTTYVRAPDATSAVRPRNAGQRRPGP